MAFVQGGGVVLRVMGTEAPGHSRCATVCCGHSRWSWYATTDADGWNRFVLFAAESSTCLLQGRGPVTVRDATAGWGVSPRLPLLILNSQNRSRWQRR